MIGYVMVGSNNIKKAMDFYDAVLAQIGLIKKDINEELKPINAFLTSLFKFSLDDKLDSGKYKFK